MHHLSIRNPYPISIVHAHAIAATAQCHPLHSIVYQHNLFEVMHYIHPVAFIPLHFKFKMKTSVKINLKVLFVNNYDWTEPPNLWHFTNEIRIRAFQTRNNNFVIFSLISIALKFRCPRKCSWKKKMYTCTMYYMWYVLNYWIYFIHEFYGATACMGGRVCSA